MNETAFVCGVCGDLAISKNFGAYTCGPCKAFFRRNALRNKLSCFFDGKCDITPITRKFCQKCRLSKCFAVGMKKDWILTEYEKIMKRKKVEENRRKRRLIENIYNNNINNNNIVFKTDYSVSDSHSCEIIPTQSPDNSRVIDTSNQSEYEISNVWTPDSEDTPNDNTMISHEAIDQHIINDSIVPRLADQLADKELFLSNQQKFKLSTVSIVRHISNFSISFNEFEINKIRELLTALKWIREPTGNTVIAELDDPVQYKMTMAARFNTLILNFIQMTKQLNPFNNLCGNDMIALIKYGCIENLLMRSLEYYNPKDRYWTINTDHNSSLLLKLDFTAKCEPFLGDCYIRYFDIMCPEWDSDELIMDLLTAIVLFDPNRPNLKYRDVIELEQNLYMYLLLRYILLKYRADSSMAKLKFLRIMSSIKEINALGEVIKINWSNASPSDVGPVISEILDLGNPATRCK